MVIDLTNIEKQLEDDYGTLGVNYLYPQLDIIRSARKLPSDMEDARLVSEKFYLSYRMIEQWLAPVILPINDNLQGLEAHLSDLQSQIHLSMQQHEIKYWLEITRSRNKTIQALYGDISSLRSYILEQRELLLKSAHRNELPELFGLVLWPFSEFTSVRNAIEDVRKIYFGPNNSYRKQNMITDSLILTALCEDVLTHKSQTKESFRQIDTLIETSLTFRRVEEQFEWSKYQRDASDGSFNENQLFDIIDNLLPGYPRSDIRKGLNTFYDSSKDNYPIGQFIAWLSDMMRSKTMSIKGDEQPGKLRLKKEHLLGLSIMDKHRNSEILGNIGQLQGTFERILAPFHELKQSNVFMQSSQFVIDNVIDLPSRAWIYDFSGVETEILRSTLFMLSDRQPKFDILEMCQKLSNIVLSGRVDRNDVIEGNYTITNKLPTRIWEYISEQLMKILEETLIKEETQSVRLLKSIFHSEGKTSLITSKKFVPVFLVKTDFKKGVYFNQRGIFPEEMSIWVRENFSFQYRHAEMCGYPWYYDTNFLLESLVCDALSLPSHKVTQIHENVNLRQTVFTVDDLTYIIYYQVDEKACISALAFKEVDMLEKDGIDPVEIIYRPHKYLSLGPDKNKLHLVLDKARAQDPKDLMTIIANLQY